MKPGYRVHLFLIGLLIFCPAGCTAIRQRRQAQSNYEQAVQSEQAGHPKDAIFSLQLATRQNPSLLPAHSLLGDLYKQSGDYDLAGREYAACTQLDPKSAEHFYDLALMDHLLGRFSLAADSYEHSLELTPVNADANMNLGLAYLSLGDDGKAIEHLRLAASQNPKSLQAWTNLGVGLDQSGDYVGAEKAYRKALELDGDHAPLYINYAGNLIQQRRPDDAIQYLQLAIDLTDTPLVEKRMGDALAAKGWLDAAIGRYQRATKMDPHYVNAYNALGDTLILLYDRGLQLNEGQRKSAIDAWRTSLTVEPNQPAVVAQLKKWQ